MSHFRALLSITQPFSVLPTTGVVITVAGGGRAHHGGTADCLDYQTPTMDGIGTGARFNYPWGIVFDAEDNVLYVGDCVSGCIESHIF